MKINNHESSLYTTKDGSHSLHSAKFGAYFHSVYGAIQETEHVFIDAALRYKSKDQKSLSILGIGFGTGLNAYMTYLEGQRLKLALDYVAIEAYPISIDQAQQLNYASILADKSEPNILQMMHGLSWEEVHQITQSFQFKKCNIPIESVDYNQRFDIIYFDAFAPEVQDHLWSNEVMSKMFKALKPKGIWVSYCAKGIVKRTLKSVGFQVESIPGPPGKREMTRATRL